MGSWELLSSSLNYHFCHCTQLPLIRIPSVFFREQQTDTMCINNIVKHSCDNIKCIFIGENNCEQILYIYKYFKCPHICLQLHNYIIVCYKVPLVTIHHFCMYCMVISSAAPWYQCSVINATTVADHRGKANLLAI